jgi:hypothetical protein
MKLDEVRAYWGDWVLKEAAGDSFVFLEETDPVPPIPDFAIDKDILLPCQCDSPAMRTICLRQLISKGNDSGKTFHELVELVDTLEVSSMSVIIFLSYLISF